MEKRLSRTDLMFALGFLFLLIVAVGAFFYGVQVGAARESANHESSVKTASAKSAVQHAYSQQDLVSFYHTVFLPHREWTSEWSLSRQRWLSDDTADRSAALSELAKLANNKYDSAKVSVTSSLSPLLVEAQESYLKSLKLYSTSFSKLSSSANEGSTADFMAKLQADSYYKEALRQQFTAQNKYYAAMLEWGSTVNSDLPSSYSPPGVIKNEEWLKLPLLVKNRISSEHMSPSPDSYDFLPQDLTARIDQFISSGQAQKMKLKTIGAIMDTLIGTDAVRSGDFLTVKSRLYSKQLLPQLPFFSADK